MDNKFKIGDLVYVIFDNEIRQFWVNAISQTNGEDIKYKGNVYLKGGKVLNSCEFSESKLIPSREECLDIIWPNKDF